MSLRLFVSISLFFLTFYTFSQDIPNLVTEGVVTTTTNQRIPFKKFRKEGIEVVFFNTLTRSDYRYLPNSIKKIEDKELNILYINPKFENEPNIKEKYIDPEAKLFKPTFPDGVYFTSSELINKTPSNTEKLIPGEIDNIELDVSIHLSDNCNFYYKKSGRKVKNVYAVSHNGFLYFQIKTILKNKTANDKNQKSDYPNSFVRVKNGGNKYLYTEAYLANFWDEVFTFATTNNYALTQSLTTLKGIVWDFKNQEFNIFKNCEDYNNFIKSIAPEKIENCESELLLKNIRETIDLIK